MPCNVLVIDNEDGSTKVVFPNAKSLLEVTDNYEILELSSRVDSLLRSAFDSIS